MHIVFWWGNWKEGGCLNVRGVDGRIIFKRVFKYADFDGLDCFQLFQDIWRAAVKIVANFLVP
jgi:hypothetical protein